MTLNCCTPPPPFRATSPPIRFGPFKGSLGGHEASQNAGASLYDRGGADETNRNVNWDPRDIRKIP